MNFDLTPEELNVIGAGLQELPMKVSLPIWNKLQQQYKQNLAEAQEPFEEMPPQ